jgi:hypothetical protein
VIRHARRYSRAITPPKVKYILIEDGRGKEEQPSGSELKLEANDLLYYCDSLTAQVIAMAPAAVEVIKPVPVPAFKGPSEYKETFNAGPLNYKKETEERGSEKYPPARYPSYLPTWDPEKK